LEKGISAVTDPTRPVLRWHGGKWKLAPWIISHFPRHRVYVEPFGGAASVLLRKPRSYAEVYNDLDDDVVNLFRVLQDPAQACRLVELLYLTPFARAEFDLSYEPTEDPIERARRLVIRSYMGFGSNAHASTPTGHRSTGFRANAHRNGTTPASDWASYPAALEVAIARWRGVIVEHRDAFEVIAQHDRAETLFFLDPPYVHETRSSGSVNHLDVKYRMYRHEMDDAAHARLLEAAADVAGMVVLSGYASKLYDRALAHWTRLEVPAYADGARPRTEVLWLNPACASALDRQHAGHGSPLFSHAIAKG
jgi:DNA adenine methylase